MSNIPSQWTTDGFMKRFEELLQNSRTYLDAYLAAEDEHKVTFGTKRYSGYDSFRMTRKQLLYKKMK